MAATTIPTTTPNHPHLSRRFAAAMAALALAGTVTAGVMIVDDDSTSPAPAVVQPSPVDKDAVRLQNSRSLSGSQPVDKDVVRLQNLQSIDGSRADTGAGTVELRFGPA